MKRKHKQKNTDSKIMPFLSKLSKSFMLPISLLPFAGLLLGIGSTMISNGEGMTYTIGLTMKNIGDIAFNNLPALFAISIAIAFTDDAGVAGLTAFIGWLVFNGFIGSFMNEGDSTWMVNINFQLSDKAINYDPAIPGLKNNLFEGFVFSMNNEGYYPPIYDTINGSPYPQQEGMVDALVRYINSTFTTTLSTDDIVSFKINSVEKNVTYYNLWFWQGEQIGVSNRLTTDVLGVKGTLNTGVFAAIAVGMIVSILYKKFYKIQLPSFISFFGGVRFVPIVTLISMVPLSCLFILTWPSFGTALNLLGEKSGELPFGMDSLVFGFFKRGLIPFGLHHAFYAPLWWTGAGGALADYVDVSMIGNANTLGAMGDQSIILAVLGDEKLKLQDVRSAGLHIGRFMSGEFSIMMLGLPLAAVGMWYGLPKDSRKQFMGIYFSAAFTCFLTGITEPLEFTFLFVAPWLYYGIHVPLFAISYMLANIFAIQIGMTFSGGFLDFIIFGIIPTFSGHVTNWWISILVGLVYAPIYFFIFYFVTKYTNIQIPGKGTVDKLMTKEDFRNKNTNVESKVGSNDEIKKIAVGSIEFLGGFDNISSVDACATRLRVSVNDSSLVLEDKFKTIGAVAASKKGNYIQVIFGGKSDLIKTQIKEMQANRKDEKNEKKE